MKIENLNISARAKTCLSNAGYIDVDSVRKLSRDEMLSIHNMSERCVDEIMESLSEEVIIDKCVYRLYDDGYHMIKVVDNSVVEVNIPQFINGIQVISVGQESILEVNPPGFWGV